jgi:hypothetical protein
MASSAYGATDWIAEYSLSEPCGFTNIQDSPSIQFKTEFDRKTKPNRIIGFSIIVIGEQNEEEVLRKANQQAKRLADIMSFKAQKRVIYYWAGLMKKIGTNPNKWTTSRIGTVLYHRLQDIELLDLKDNTIAQMIEHGKEINHRLHHASIAMGAEELQLFVTMFTELFQVIEGETTLKDYWKYSALRDVISHRELDPKRAMARVKQFYLPPNDFTFTPNNEFDHNSEKNLRQLKSEANDLKKLAMSYLGTKMP